MRAKYDDVATEYDEWVGAGSALDDAAFTELTGDVAGQEICVVACGQGREARYLAGRGAVVTAVDLSEKLLERARQHEETQPLGISYRQGDAHTLDGVGTDSFDGAVCHMSLMDIPDLDGALHSMARILKPGGWYVVSITHPCFKTPATGELVDHVDKSIKRTVGKYYAEGYWDGPGAHRSALPVGAYHRTLSTYVNTLTAADLTIDQLREPPGDTPIWREVPQLLYIKGHLSPARQEKRHD
ncbi:ubiquinone/menaquinone biosynthesis C-methylase UbiE [Kribbella voronezhensis]|uniref:Ubiquinone/menaquinone biosynthesis C-methylase UbiE n=1 Tax=Kribbella voronezhensis TaxID=2512212 RepID=A0A4R7T7Q8_9ACTN|nr:class I SAM-dependent methyltransferase [Kribbella voronezhensis]TDU87911.1 ubiquinone/menaquinone biosynthesis C-methylase UbiE [Kribbella voronezhensis]